MLNTQTKKEEKEATLIKEIESSGSLFSAVPKDVITNTRLAKHHSAFRTFVVLNLYAGGTGVTFASNKTIQEMCPDQTDKVLKDNLKILEGMGEVYRVLDRKGRRGTRRYLVFRGTWRIYYERCIKLGLFEEAAKVKAFFGKVSFQSCLDEIKEKITKVPSRSVEQRTMMVRSIKQRDVKERKENSKESQKNFSKTSLKNLAAAPFQKSFSLKEGLIKNLGESGAKRAEEYWDSLTEAKQKSIRNVVGFLTHAIKHGLDKEKAQKEREKTFKSAREMNREFALEINELLKPIEVSTYISKDYFEVYNGTWNRVFHFGDASRNFKMQTSLLLKKFGIELPDLNVYKKNIANEKAWRCL